MTDLLFNSLGVGYCDSAKDSRRGCSLVSYHSRYIYANDLLISCLLFLSFLTLLVALVVFSTFFVGLGDFLLCLVELPLFDFTMSVTNGEE